MTDQYWNLPLQDLPALDNPGLPTYYRDWIDHPTHDDYWKRWSIDADYSRLTVPALHFTGWYDGFLRGTVDNYVGHARRGARRAAAGRVAVDARAVDARVGLRRLEPGVHERRRCPSGLVRPPAQGTGRRRVRRQHLHPARRLARLPRLAAARDATPRPLPPLGRARQLPPRRRRPLGRGAGRRARRRLHLRPRPAHVERGRPLVLRRVGDADGPRAAGRRRVDEGRPRLHERAAGRRPDAGRGRRGRPARGVDRRRHRLRRPPVRGRPGRRLAKPPGGARPRPLPKRLRVPRAAGAWRAGGVPDQARAGRHPDPEGLSPARRHRELRLPDVGPEPELGRPDRQGGRVGRPGGGADGLPRRRAARRAWCCPCWRAASSRRRPARAESPRRARRPSRRRGGCPPPRSSRGRGPDSGCRRAPT